MHLDCQEDGWNVKRTTLKARQIKQNMSLQMLKQTPETSMQLSFPMFHVSPFPPFPLSFCLPLSPLGLDGFPVDLLLWFVRVLYALLLGQLGLPNGIIIVIIGLKLCKLRKKP